MKIGSYKSNTEGQPNPIDIYNAKDFKSLDPGKQFSRYYRLGKYLKGIKIGWIPEGGEIDAPDKVKTVIALTG